jgi:peptide/nickel transport system ATP-binding protein
LARLLEVEDLHLTLSAAEGLLHVLRGIHLAVDRGETVGIVGESGCGKSMTALSIMGLLPRGARRNARRLSLNGTDLLAHGEHRMRNLRGRHVAMVFQDPGTALNPTQPIGRQLGSVWRRHFPAEAARAADRAVELLERVGIRGAAGRLSQYPHQLSGGQRQRVMIALALMARPSLLLADEPTTALDVTVQARVLHLLRSLQRETQIGMLLITHDLGVVAAVADRVAVMYAGEIVERGRVADVLGRPAHPYTRRLLACVPDLSGGARLGTIPGQVPPPGSRVAGCAFAPRCDSADAACRGADIPWREAAPGHAARCLRTGAIQAVPAYA